MFNFSNSSKLKQEATLGNFDLLAKTFRFRQAETYTLKFSSFPITMYNATLPKSIHDYFFHCPAHPPKRRDLLETSF